MGINISVGGFLGSNYSGINKNSKQYQAAAKDFLGAHRAEVASMTPEQKMMYELFGGEGAYMKNVMLQYDSEGYLLNSSGVAGMCANGIPESESHQIITVSESARQDMYDETLRHFIQEKGVANGNTTKRSEVYTKYQLSLPKSDRLKGTWSRYSNTKPLIGRRFTTRRNPPTRAGSLADLSAAAH